MRLRCYHDQTIAEILTDSVTKMMWKLTVLMQESLKPR
jgi:hypothetical protein